MDRRKLKMPRADRELTIDQIADLTGAKPRQGDRLATRISNFAPLDTATASDISYLENPKYAEAIKSTHAGACFVAPRFEASAPKELTILVTPQPYRAFVAVACALFPTALRPSSLFGESGRNAQAHIHPLARLEEGVTVDPLAAIGPYAEVGRGTVIAVGAVVGAGVCIGRECAIGAGATIQHSLIGDRVIIHPGARIGQDGFGYLPGARGHQKIPQSRRVIIQDDVEIGANTTVDRGSTRDTVIGEGSKIDNLVQIAHNVSIGRHCLIVAQVGISGSTVVGDFALLGGQVGVSDHLTIGAGAMVGARAGVMDNIPAGGRWAGYPAEPVVAWKRNIVAMRRFVRRERKSRGDAE